MKKIICMVLLLGTIKAVAQQYLYQGLSIGDTLPAMVFRNVINSSDGTLDLTNLDGRSLIIDFGGTYCPPCLESLLKMNRLQPDYKDRVLMVMANKQKLADWKTLFEKRPLFENLSIPIITEDTLLYRLFPHFSEPHVIWVDKDRVIRGITGGGYINKWGINKFLNNELKNWPVKWDFRFNDSVPLVRWNGESVDARMVPDKKTMGFVSGYMPGIFGQGVVIDSVLRQKRYIGCSVPLLMFYGFMLLNDGKQDFKKNQIFLGKDIDPKRFFYERNDSIPYENWVKLHAISYEFTVPLAYTLKKSIELVWQNVSDFSELDVKWEPKRSKVLVVKGRVRQNKIIEGNSESLIDFLYRAMDIYKGPIIIDEFTHDRIEKSRIRIPVVDITSDLQQLKTALQEVGVESQIEERSVKMLSIIKKSY